MVAEQQGGAKAGDDGQGALVERLQAQLRKAAGEMREEGQNGWPVTCDDAADRIEALTRENAALRADKERLERERDEARELYIRRVRRAAIRAERRLAEQGQAQGAADRQAVDRGEASQAEYRALYATPPSPEPDAELVEALEPFTSIAIVGSLPDNIRADFSLPVTVGDLRRLRIAALRRHRKQGGE